LFSAGAREYGNQQGFPGHGKSCDDEVIRLTREFAMVPEEWDFLGEAARYHAREST